MGQIGTAIKKVLEDKHPVDGIGPNDEVDKKYDFIHICFPFEDQTEFVNEVKRYQNLYLKEDGVTVVHSTVAVGTCQEVGAVHSPVRGVHPDLEEGVRTFVKYFGGLEADLAAKPFEECGVEVYMYPRSRDVEALKLWSTTYYGWNIMFNKAVHEYCKENQLDPKLVYIHANATYNHGYHKLGRGEVLRPVLKYMQGKIGGHCVIPNCSLLEGDIANFILEKNDAI